MNRHLADNPSHHEALGFHQNWTSLETVYQKGYSVYLTDQYRAKYPFPGPHASSPRHDENGSRRASYRQTGSTQRGCRPLVVWVAGSWDSRSGTGAASSRARSEPKKKTQSMVSARETQWWTNADENQPIYSGTRCVAGSPGRNCGVPRMESARLRCPLRGSGRLGRAWCGGSLGRLVDGALLGWDWD